MDDEQIPAYLPDMNVVRSARAFIRCLCEAYGAERGMAVWEHIREGLGDRMAADIFLGMLMGSDEVEVRSVVPMRKIEAIKQVRSLTGMGLKEAKDFVEKVEFSGPQRLSVVGLDTARVDSFVQGMQRIGCNIA